MLSLWWMFYQSNSYTLFWVKPSQEKVFKGVKSENFPKPPLALFFLDLPMIICGTMTNSR